jgi:hypothetical protein
MFQKELPFASHEGFRGRAMLFSEMMLATPTTTTGCPLGKTARTSSNMPMARFFNEGNQEVLYQIDRAEDIERTFSDVVSEKT